MSSNPTYVGMKTVKKNFLNPWCSLPNKEPVGKIDYDATKTKQKQIQPQYILQTIKQSS